MVTDAACRWSCISLRFTVGRRCMVKGGSAEQLVGGVGDVGSGMGKDGGLVQSVSKEVASCEVHSSVVSCL